MIFWSALNAGVVVTNFIPGNTGTRASKTALLHSGFHQQRWIVFTFKLSDNCMRNLFEIDGIFIKFTCL
jgi:hypothetical protein